MTTLNEQNYQKTESPFTKKWANAELASSDPSDRTLNQLASDYLPLDQPTVPKPSILPAHIKNIQPIGALQNLQRMVLNEQQNSSY